MTNHKAKEKIAVFLLNLGGPETLDDVEPFLVNLFSDRKIIRLGPWFMQKFIARRIARKRAPKSRACYRQIGGGSPLKKITAAQGMALDKELAAVGDFTSMTVMRYWPPYAAAMLADCRQQGITKIVALTLYPHYSLATTGSSMDDLERAVAESSSSFDVIAIESWPDEDRYIQCLAHNIIQGMTRFGEQRVALVYSAHSLPVKFIEAGDPYLEQLKDTIAAIEDKTGIKGRLAFQSRSGPVEWLGPSTPDMLELLGAEGCQNVLMLPISFVSDHVETLYEIDILYRGQAKDLGMRLERVDSLNTQPAFIEGLAGLVIDACRKQGWVS